MNGKGVVKMERAINVFNKMVKDIKKLDEEEQFETMFILTCMLIYRLSCNGEQLDTILQLINEFDYKKNFNYKESESD